MIGTIKNANGMGSVYRLKGNRRKPWVACVTRSIKKVDGTYQQKRKIIGYYETYDGAQFSLWNYNKHPALFNKMNEIGALTFKNVYKEWSKTKYKHISKSAINGYKAAYAKCDSIKDLPMKDIKTYHFQEILNNSQLSIASDLKLKSLLVLVSNYAMQNDIINKNYAKYIEINRKKSKEMIHKPFTEKEIELLMDHDSIPYVDTILIMIYTGLRIGELLMLKTKDVNLQNMTIRGGSKTSAGIDRLIPVHAKIRKYVAQRYNVGSEYLIHDEQKQPLDYQLYRKQYFDKIMEKLYIEHLPHDCRHTFATRLSNVGANTTTIKKLVGHSNYQTTEKIYTHKDMRQLRCAIEMLE